jgi:hypothetical protein
LLLFLAGHVLAQLVEVLRHKQEGSGFDFFTGLLGFFTDLIF